jgi:hypothetical protein
MQQVTNTIFMVRPISFRMNKETALNNYYQQELSGTLSSTINTKAQKEFDNFVKILTEKGIKIIVIQDTKNPDTPDAIFPNNWISLHENGDIALYPMFAKNRRLERREDILNILEEEGFCIENCIDYSEAEKEGYILEGTGSMVLDRQNRKAYCALSARANEDLFIEFCEDFEYTPVLFTANQSVENSRKPIYHTNVMMSIAETFAIICLDAIDDKKERKNVIQHLRSDKKEIISITEKQVAHFAGNMLQVIGRDEERFLIMSSSAFHSLTTKQIKNIENHCKIVHSPLTTIETCGGGSCMMAEIFLKKEN